jgi:hypothetical protein
MRFVRKTLQLIIAFALFLPLCLAQLEPPPSPQAPPSADWSNWLGPSGSGRIRARLRDESTFAAQHSAAVEVEVQNVYLSSVNLISRAGIVRGLLQYHVDNCPTVVTTDTRLRFDQLASGKHTITVAVIDFNSRLMTPQVILHAKIP